MLSFTRPHPDFFTRGWKKGDYLTTTPEVEVNSEIYSTEPRSGEVNIFH